MIADALNDVPAINAVLSTYKWYTGRRVVKILSVSHAEPTSKFTVPVVRIGYAVRDIEVEATTQEEANEKALDCAGGHDFNEHTSDYKLGD